MEYLTSNMARAAESGGEDRLKAFVEGRAAPLQAPGKGKPD
jgi:hypothetical protein